jgi:hypothetical protein
MTQDLKSRLNQPVDIASAALFRVFFGVMAAFSSLRFFWYGWIDRFFYQRDVFFKFFGFGWVEVLPWPGMYILFGVLALLGVFVALGLFYRVSIALFFVGFTYVGLVDKTLYLNHYWFFRIVAFLMIFMPLGKVFSLDAWRGGTLGEESEAVIGQWVVYTLRLQMGLLYLFAGIAKLEYDWLILGQPLGLWLGANTHLPLVGLLFDYDWFPILMAWAGTAFDLSIFFFLLHRKTRIWAYLAVVVFHAFTGVLFNIGMFPVIMIGITTIFFDPDWPRRWLPENWQKPGGLLPKPGSAVNYPDTASGVSLRRPVAWFLALFFTVQSLIPLRHLVYPGWVLWTHEGFKFSWRVMLVEKNGDLSFEVRHPESGKSWVVQPRDYLDERQTTLVSTIPDFALQFAHYLERDFRDRGYEDVEIYADSWVSVNGRSSKQLIDPDVDLSERNRTLGHYEWILPFETR